MAHSWKLGSFASSFDRNVHVNLGSERVVGLFLLSFLLPKFEARLAENKG